MVYVFCGESALKFSQAFVLKPEDTFFHLPLIEKKPIPLQPLKRNHYDFIVVSSQNIITHFFKHNKIKGAQWFAVGPETAKLAHKKWGIQQVQIPEQYNAVSVADKIIQHKKKGFVLWLGAKGGVTNGIQKLKKNGFYVEVITPYQSQIKNIQSLAKVWESKNLDLNKFLSQEAIWIFTSPTTAKSYFSQNLNRATHKIACLGATTASVFLQKKITPYYVAKKKYNTELS